MSKRILRVNQLIKKELGQLLLKEIDLPKNVLVTITRVKASLDLDCANIYISVIPENQNIRVLRILKRQIYHLQQKLTKRLKMKTIPRIKFLEEKEASQAGRIEEILEKLKKEEK